MGGILEGIRVVEVAAMAAAPSATVILADLGAEVIKVEPSSGDLWRYGHKVVPMPPSDVPYTTFIQNRTKKSVALNLNVPAAQAALHKLAATADVFLTNSPRQVLFDEIQKIIGAHDLSAIAEILRKGHVNFSVTQTTEECTRDEHMIANGCFPEVDGCEGIRTVDSPIQIEAQGIDKVKPRKPPGIGEHTLSELMDLGYSEADVRAMAEARAVGLPR